MTDFVLHVGLPKTATTTLQRSLFEQHPEIYFLGKGRSFPAPKGCRSDSVHNLLEPILWRHRARYDPAASRAAAENTVLADLTGQSVIVGSWETLVLQPRSKAFRESLRRLVQAFGNCRVLVSLRNPGDWVSSLYLQELQGHFKKRNRKHIGGRAFQEPEEWLRRKTNDDGALGGFGFGWNIREAVDLLGKENIGVFLYEELRQNPAAYYTGICRFLGIDVEEGLRLTADKHFHPRITEKQLALLRETDASIRRRLAWRMMNDSERRKLFKSAAGKDDDRPATINFPDSLQERLAEEYRKHYQWIEAQFGLPLEQHGYPL